MEVGERLTVRTRDEWRRWLTRHHQDRQQIWLVYNKKSSGKGGITYDESVEEALCYGWIDGQIRTIDEATYAARFTPRRATSNWSQSNLERLERLLAAGKMAPAGLALLPPGVKRPKQRA